MRKLLTLIIICTAVCALQAQKKKDSKPAVKIEASKVPDSVKLSQEHAYPGLAVTKWELHTGKTPGKGDHYTASFSDKAGQKTHTRYEHSGKLVSKSVYYEAPKLPAVVTEAAKRYTGYTVSSVEEVFSVKKNRTRYEVKLKGTAGKKSVDLDDKGAEMPKSKGDREDGKD